MKLVKELLALSEAKKNMYQVRMGNHRYEDKELNIRDLETLAKEVSMDPSGKESESHSYGDLAALHDYILDYHGCGEAQKKSADIFDVVDEDYDIKSFKDDVLIIDYHFTIRYNKDTKEPRKVKDTISLMPGN